MEENKPLSEHFEELRSLIIRLLILWGGATLLASFYTSSLISFLLEPYGDMQVSFLLLSPLEGWWTALFVSLLGGILIALPFLLYLILCYVLPALYPEESRRVLFLGGFTLFFSCLGFWVGHFLFAPLVIRTLQTTLLVPGIPAYAVREALHFVVSIDLGVIVLLNLMGGLLTAVMKGWISPEALSAWRRPFVLGAFVLGAVLTPPDVLSQILMAGGLILGFEMVIFLGKVTGALYGSSRGHRFRSGSGATDQLLPQSYPEGPEIPL